MTLKPSVTSVTTHLEKSRQKAVHPTGPPRALVPSVEISMLLGKPVLRTSLS